MINPEFNQSSPPSSKNSSSDSLNFIMGDQKSSLDGGSLSGTGNCDLLNSNTIGGACGDYSLNNYNLSKKKGLKSTLYRMFTQRKKVQKMRTLQKSSNPQLASADGNFYSVDTSSQNQLTIKTESDKKIKKK